MLLCVCVKHCRKGDRKDHIPNPPPFEALLDIKLLNFFIYIHTIEHLFLFLKNRFDLPYYIVIHSYNSYEFNRCFKEICDWNFVNILLGNCKVFFFNGNLCKIRSFYMQEEAV